MAGTVHDAPILDYAGPISRSNFRLAAKSELHITPAPDRLVVRETLAGREGAIVALLFAAFVIVIMAAMQFEMAHKWRRNKETMALYAAMMIAEGAVGAMVINQTWRRTVLEVTPQEISLTFAAPFGQTTHLRWPAEQVADVAVVDSLLGNDPKGQRVPELALSMWSGPPVRLFTGHPHTQLTHLAHEIRFIQPTLPQKATM